MKQNSRSSSNKSEQKTDTCATNLIELSRKHFDCDTQWNASMPYPTWPFTRVRGSELVKRERLARSQSIEQLEEALL
jgi:hypothetical protein